MGGGGGGGVSIVLALHGKAKYDLRDKQATIIATLLSNIRGFYCAVKNSLQRDILSVYYSFYSTTSCCMATTSPTLTTPKMVHWYAGTH